jgi:phosphoglycolate phosphatase
VGNVQRLIAFDLDGTLIDSRRDLADAANDLIVTLGGIPLPDESIAEMVGDGAAMLVRRALLAAGLPEKPDAVTRFLEFYDERLLNYTRPYPGIIDVVRVAREHARVVVLTNKPKHPSERILEGLGMRALFDEVVGGDGPLPRKPDPASLLALIDGAGADTSTALMVGDSPVDYRTAANAGVRCCLVSFGFGFAKVSADDRAAVGCVAVDAPALLEAIRRFVAAIS